MIHHGPVLGLMEPPCETAVRQLHPKQTYAAEYGCGCLGGQGGRMCRGAFDSACPDREADRSTCGDHGPAAVQWARAFVEVVMSIDDKAGSGPLHLSEKPFRIVLVAARALQRMGRFVEEGHDAGPRRLGQFLRQPRLLG